MVLQELLNVYAGYKNGNIIHRISLPIDPSGWLDGLKYHSKVFEALSDR